MMTGASGAENDVKIEPVAGIALARKPSPLFAERIEIDQEKEKHAEHAELDADGAAGAEAMSCLGENGRSAELSV